MKILGRVLGRTQRSKRKLPAWETYNGQIADMRRQGHTLQEIGNTVGVTRERVRQILTEHYGRVEISLFKEAGAAKIIGCSAERLKKLRENGVVVPTRSGKWFWLYSRGEMEKAMLALQRNCEHCGAPLPIKNIGKRCPKCKADYVRNTYPFKNDEGKRKHIESCIRWQKNHPERHRKLCNKAVKKYQQRKNKEHYAKTQYLVVYGEVMPIGSIVKATGCENSHLILENGLRISTLHVKKIN